MGPLIHRGTIIAYDQEAMTCKIQDNEPTSPNNVYDDVICPFIRYDEKNNAYDFVAPSANSPCLFLPLGTETFLLTLYSPHNAAETGTSTLSSKSCLGSNDSHKPEGMTNYKVSEGTNIHTNSMGSTESFTDSLKKIVMFPEKLQSVWNIMNCIWENVCLIFRLHSGPMDIDCEVTENKDTKPIADCNTTIKVRENTSERAEGATTMIDLRMGKDAGIIQLNINGENLLHIDANRNVILTTNRIDLSATDINIDADNLNCLNVGRVDLP